MTEPLDDLSDLLEPHPHTTSATLRDLVFRRTERRLARGRWQRRAARAALFVGIFGLGGLVGWTARPERERTVESPAAIQTVFVPLPVPVPMPVPDRTPLAPTTSRLTASAAELQAELQDDPNAAAKLYRQAGDVFLRREDYANATRCYRLYLTRAGDAALALDSADSWLLVSLKNAAFREKIDVTQNDS